jgi:hypothetical protein
MDISNFVQNCMAAENIKSGFRACGIIPFSPLAIPGYAYLPSEPTENFNQTNSSPSKSPNYQCRAHRDRRLPTQKVAPSGDAAVSNLDQQSTWFSVVYDVVIDFPAITAIDHIRQPEIDDPQHLLQLIMDDKIEVVPNDTADGVVALSDTWNADVNSLFLPCDSTSNIASKTKTTTDRAVSRQSHRLLTSVDVEKNCFSLKRKQTKNRKS